MRLKLLAIGIALVCLAAPAQGAFADDSCAPCCAKSRQQPCERGEGPCTFLGATPCCDAAPAVPAAPALRSLESPDLQPGMTSARFELPAVRSLQLLRFGGEPSFPTSPLRLSVVLQI
jgi:hypothetical protein